LFIVPFSSGFYGNQRELAREQPCVGGSIHSLPLAARTDDGYDEHMSDAPEPTLSPNETASSPGIGMVFRR
jgi:hypothetical protein